MFLPIRWTSGSPCRHCFLSLLLLNAMIVHFGHSFLVPLSNTIGLSQRQPQQGGQSRSIRQQSWKSASGRYSKDGAVWSSNTTSTSSSTSTSYEISNSGDALQRRPFAAATATTTTTSTATSPFIKGPPKETKPDYENIHGPMGKAVDQVLLRIFRSRMAEHIGVDSNLPQDDYQGLMELALALNSRFSSRSQVQQIAQTVLRSCFPSWLPPQYKILFSGPFPQFSARMNAWATYIFGFWLMGEVTINSVESKDGTVVLKDQGVLVKRCRFLEESGCASVCVNSCKIPTQNFFLQDMGIPLTMTPDYDTFECQFSFGVSPDALGEDEVKNTPCLLRCPTAGAMRSWHNDNTNNKSINNTNNKNVVETNPTTIVGSVSFSSPNNDLIDSSMVSSSTSKCHLMEGLED